MRTAIASLAVIALVAAPSTVTPSPRQSHTSEMAGPELIKTLFKRSDLRRQLQELRQANKVDESIAIASEILIIDRQVFGDGEEAADTLNVLAELLERRRDYDRAEASYVEGLAILRRVLGDSHQKTARTINNLGALYSAKGDFARAKPLLEESVALTRKVFGEAHTNTTAAIENLAYVSAQLHQYEFARTLYEEALAIHRSARGNEHPLTGQSLGLLAGVLETMGNYRGAQSLYQESLAVQRKVHGEDSFQTAIALNNLAFIYSRNGDDKNAVPLYQQSLAVRRKLVGDAHLDLVVGLSNLALAYVNLGEYALGQASYEECIEILRKAGGEDQPQAAVVINNLAHLHGKQGDFGRARALYEQSLAITRKVHGENHPDYANRLINLGAIYRDQGDYARARPLLEQALAIVRAVFGTEHPNTAAGLHSLALLHSAQGDYAGARPLYERSLAIRQKAHGDDHPDTAVSLNSLAVVHHKLGDFARARQLYEQSVEIRRKVLGTEHPDTATSLNNLALLFEDLGDLASARLASGQSLAIKRKVLGEDHPDTADSLNNLGALFLLQGDRVGARPLFERSLAIYQRVLGDGHPTTAISLHNLAILYQGLGDGAGARSMFERSLGSTQTHLALAAAAQSERQQLIMTASLRSSLDSYLSFVTSAGGDVTAAWRATAAWKGAALVRRRAYTRVAQDPNAKGLLTELQQVTQQLQVQAFQTPAPERAEAWRRHVADLSTRKEALEVQLSGRSAAFRLAQRPAAEALTAALPVGTALVDFLEYSHSTLTAAGPLTVERRLVAFVVQAGRPTRLLALGPVAAVDAALTPWRGAVTAGGEPPSDVASTLRRLVWDPVEAVLSEGQATQVVLSPDGILNQLAFVALPGRAPGTYVLDDWSLAVVPSAQVLVDLLDEDQPTPATGNLFALGDVDYDRQEATAAPRTPRAFPSARAPREDDATFARLLGTRGELASLERLYRTAFGDAGLETLADARATEAAVRERLPQYRYLHLATHGFFASPRVASALARSTETPRLGETGGTQSLAGYHPGLLSGLALAGANAPMADDDGILTAEEVATLDLSGVELAVLSACETGLGRVAGGEGVLGLQRAFHAAGARTVVASLWKVDDTATRDLMERFYDNVWNKDMGKLAALNEAQRWMLRTRGARGLTPPAGAPPVDRLPPYYWAAFVLSGAWR